MPPRIPLSLIPLFALLIAITHAQEAPPLPYLSPGATPEAHAYSDNPVNVHRIYDFYQRQAAYYLEHPDLAKGVLPEFPGLDGGSFGHSGAFSQNSYIDDSWSQMDVGDVVSCTLRAEGMNLLKALTFQLGTEDAPKTFVFDPVTLRFVAFWDGRVRFGDRRWGIVENVYAGGDPVRMEDPKRNGTFLGYYLVDGTPILHYNLGEQEIHEALSLDSDGKLKRESLTEEDVRQLLSEASPRWDWSFTAAGTIADDTAPYVIDSIPVPLENPYNALMFLAGHDFFSDGRAAVSTIMGDIWIVSGIDDSLEKVTWRRFAAGLNQPLGLVIVDDVIHALCKDRILRLHDLNEDGEADYFESFCDYPTSQGGHDYATDLQRDAEGNFYFSTKHIGTVKVSRDGKTVETLATGIRNPNGIGVRSDGLVVTAPQEGTWTPASMILESRDQRFFGLGATKERGIDPAICYVPRGVDNSTGGQVFVEMDGWGPLKDQLLVLSYGYGKHYLVLLDESTGVRQGAAVPLRGDFAAAPNRARFSPHDGQLYVTGSEGWGDYATKEGSFERMRYTGQKSYLPLGFEVRSNGILLRFSEPLDPASATDVSNWFAQQWNYQYSQQYGSPEFSVREPSKVGHDPVRVASVYLLGDARSVFVEIPDILPVMQFHLYGNLRAADGTAFQANLFPTIHRLGERFEEIASLTAAVPNKPRDLLLRIRWPEPKPEKRNEVANGRPIIIKTVTGLQFGTKEFRVKPGERISLTLDNTDVIPHNLVIVQPGTMEEIGNLSAKMLSDPNAADKDYVPDHEGVIDHTAVIQGGVADTITFTAPTKPGRYPYLCTFPGHWMIMRGEMIVEE